MKSRVFAIGFVLFLATALWRPARADLLTLPDLHPEVAELMLQAEKTAREERALETLALVQQALAKAREVGDKPGEALSLFALSIGFEKMGVQSKADDFARQALAVLRRNGDAKVEVSVLNSLGTVYRWGGIPHRAVATYNQALARAQEIKYDKGAADALHNIGEVYRTTETGKAKEFYQRELEIRRRIGDKRGEAESLNSMGSMTSGLDGLNLLLQALALRRETTDLVGESETTFRLAQRYAESGQTEQVVKGLNESLTLLRRARDQRENARAVRAKKTGKAASLTINELAMEHNEKRKEASTLMMLGGEASRARQVDRARTIFEQALRINEEIGNKRGQAAALVMLGNLLNGTGKTAESISYFQRALQIHEETGNRQGISGVTHSIGSMHFQLGNLPEAEKHLLQALASYKETGTVSNASWIFSTLSSLRETQGRLDEAIDYMAEQMVFIEQNRSQWGGMSEAKMTVHAANLPNYHRYINLLLRAKKPEEAFAWAEKTKARGLIDLVSEGKVDISSGISPQQRLAQAEIRGRIDSLNLQLVAGQAGASTDNEASQEKSLKEQLSKAEAELRFFNDKLYAEHPELAQKRAAKTITLADVAAFLPEDTALLNYVSLGHENAKRAMLFVITVQSSKANLQTYPVDMATDELGELLEDFRAACVDPKKNYKSKARELYGLLIAPADSQLAGKKRLLICPDGALWGLPFQALLARNEQGSERFLVEQYEVTYSYSATAAQAALNAKTNATRAQPARSLLVLANPDFGGKERFVSTQDGAPLSSESRPIAAGSRPIGADARAIAADSRAIGADSRAIAATSRGLNALLRGDGTIASLPGTQQEADAIKSDFPDATIETGVRAQESLAKAESGHYRYLHFATHGLLNDTAPLLSSVVLAAPSKGSTDDGFLTAREIFDMNLAADMAVLSACNTASGEKRTGEGVVGLTWALFVAGVPSQVVSQWAVNDQSTAALMKVFYARLKQKDGKGEALRAAELAMLKDETYNHPYYWAPFILLGEWRN